MRALGGVFVIFATLYLLGCTTVEPWERGRLAHDCMQIVLDEDVASAQAKVEASREGSSGGVRRGGGGCGCN